MMKEGFTPPPRPIPLGEHKFKIECDLTEDRVWLVMDGKRVYGIAFEDARKLILQALHEIQAMAINRVVLQAAKDVVRKKEQEENGGTSAH